MTATCAWCGGSLDGRRRDARYCSAPCRAAASRARSNDATEPPEWFWSGAWDLEAIEGAQRRTHTARKAA